MGIFTTIAIISGIVLAVGAGATAGIYYATEADRAKARVAEIDNEISNCNVVIKNFEDLQKKIESGKKYLTDAKNDFKNGGHVLSDVPLANNEFTSCISKLDSALVNVKSIIKGYKDDKAELVKEKNDLKKKHNI